MTLGQYLKADQPGLIFVKYYKVCNHQLPVLLKMDDGKKMRQIGGLHGYQTDRKTMAVVVEEELAEGKWGKVAYAWRKIEDEGVLEKSDLRYVLAEKDAELISWKILETPRSLGSLTPKQESSQASAPTIKAVTQGLGTGKYGRSWNVSFWKNGNKASISYYWQGKSIYVYGFSKYPKVYSIIQEEKDSRGNLYIVARFYTNQARAEKNEGLLKTVIFSEYLPGQGWQPLIHPRVVEATEASSMQRRRLEMQGLKGFLLAAAANDAVYDLPPKIVDAGGYLRINIDTLSEGDSIYLGRYPDNIGQKMWGRVIVEGKIKKIYFWASAAARQSADPPINPKGHSLAGFTKEQYEKQPSWKIQRHQSTQEWRTRRRQIRIYEERLFVDAKTAQQVFVGGWRVGWAQKGKYQYTRVERMLFGCRRTFIFKRLCQPVIATREIEGWLKLAEVWPDESTMKAKLGADFQVVLTVKNQDGIWVPVYKPLQTATFRSLLRKRIVAPEQVAGLTENPYIVDNYPYVAGETYDSILNYLDSDQTASTKPLPV